MKNWRELGEVPDSDDDSFDDPGTHDDDDDDDHDQPEQPLLPRNDYVGETPVAEETHLEPAKELDIWDVPSSSPEQASPPGFDIQGQTSQLLSQPPWPAPSRQRRGAETILSAPLTSSQNGVNTSASPQKNWPRASQPFLEDEISTGYVRGPTATSGASSPLSTLSRSPTPTRFSSLSQARSHHLRASPSPPEDRGRLSHQEEDEELSRQAAVRLERSLRPRKPIQQHPYALENAQYATFMKSHGVKPIRVVQEPQPIYREAEEEDSQDREFQAEESQEVNGEGPGLLDDSGPILFDDDEDELALTPSLPKTSPHGQQLRASSPQTNADQTDATSLSDEEFPPLERLQPVSAKKRQRMLKRQRSQLLSSTQRKRPRAVPDSSSQGSPQRPRFIPPPPPNMWDLPSSPPGPAPREEPPPPPAVVPRPPARRRPSTPDTFARKSMSINGHRGNGAAAGSPIVINEDTQSDLSDEDLADSTDSSESDLEAVRQNIRKIRGVLPASWLRIDQQNDKPPTRDARRKTPEPSPDRGVRRGVALPRHGLPKPSSTAPLMLFDESSEESENERQPRHIAAEGPVQIAPTTIFEDVDDGASVVEEDTIDWMLPGRKRAGSSNTTSRAKKQKRSRTQSLFSGRPNAPSRQPKITQVLNPSKQGATSSPGKRDSTSQRRQHGGGSSGKRRSGKRLATPPLLSILDVVEPDAPRFLKIAARSVKNKANLGKTSPSKKLISLATRGDNVDALSVLRDWKSGKTKPRLSVPPSRRPEKSKSRLPLREISTNSTSRTRRAHSRKLVRQQNLDSFVLAEDGEDLQASQPRPAATLQSRKPLRDRRPSMHPAQLEEGESEDKRRQLNSRKRTLDALYKRRRRTGDTSTEDGLVQTLDVNFTLQEPVAQGQGNTANIHDGIQEIETTPAPPERNKNNARSRFRKRRCPRQADLEAPQYARANDPLPADFFVAEAQEHHPQDKLKGLGPYGTHYTHHFEVFPLDRGVFFHESTVIGRGLVRDAVDAGLSDRICHPRPAMSFLLDGQILRWGPWNDKTSSELGILIDWVAEQLVFDTTRDEGSERKAIEAVDFVLEYILRSLSVQSDIERKAFVSRCLEVFSSFINRFESIYWATVPDAAKRTRLDVVARFALAVLAVRSLSLTLSSDPMQSMKLDDLVKKSASVTIRRLLECGTEELRTLYGDLQRPTFRERGIRSDRAVANCWAVVMRLLEGAAIPRGSFWDVTQSVMLSREVVSGSDAQAFEQLWQDMFTILPLCEVDNSGLLVFELRHTVPVEGWALPQQLLKRVFQLYQANPRQPPGFNDYCRALVARCHFLVEQWGWRKCTGIIGTIFDFFGSQSLAHLRNEEVYKSPRFLEELDRKPSLSIEPEDRCFHIFIKLMALTIQRLKELGRVKDIKNLVARTLPNHNRQYLKEDTIHQHDLAALRNHHDLLCTLFWVSPPELRPAVHLIEKLVVPGSAHKEACLINVRTWNQLARFVISSDEDSAAFRPFAAWRNNIFNQVLDQYLSAASDIEQQARGLSSEMPGISKAFRDEMVAKNKATALDVLHYSVKASLDVLQRASTLEAVLCGLNTTQLQKVFTSLDYQSPGFDWSILSVALETLEHLVGRIDRVSEEQYSSEFSDNVDAPHLENAVLLVNESLTKDFFWMSRTILSLPRGRSLRQQHQHAACAEKTVTLAARIAARFIKNGLTQLLPYFSTGKHGLFSDVPKNSTTPDRKYLPLFLAVLVKNHVFDFKDLGMNVLGLWMLSVVKPQQLLGYENYLAEVLKHHNLPFLERATVAVEISPDYNSNIDFITCAIHYMRKTLRESGLAQSRQHRDEFSKTLQLVMQKMKDDLALLRPHAGEHGLYIDFVRQVISLIKSHGVGICAVDSFFTQPSVDYSPSVQDPQLHTAGIVAYGVRLSEKDVNAVPQLFHYLYNNFKIALGNDKLEQECHILGGAMKNTHVTSFMLQFMLPAIIQASAQMPECWALLEVYTGALGSVLDAGCIPEELGETDVEYAADVLGSILSWASGLNGSGGTATLSLQQLHIVTLLATIANVLQPSLTSYLINEPEDSILPGLQSTVGGVADLFAELRSQLEDLLAVPEAATTTATTAAPPLLSGLALALSSTTSRHPAPGGRNARVQDFANTIVSDVRRNWVVAGDRVMVRMAAGRGTQGGAVPTMTQAAAVSSSSAASLRGARYAPWEDRGVLKRVFNEVGKWKLGGGGDRERERRRTGGGGELLLLF